METVVPQSVIYDKISEQCGDKMCDGLVLKVPHQQQVANWDCGVVCLEMVAAFRNFPENAVKLAIEKHNMDHSVWTIDLAYLCMLLEIRHEMFTLLTEVNESFVNEPFYANQANFDAETDRANRLFAMVCENNVLVEKRKITLESIISHIILHTQPVIVLIDSAKLQTIQEDFLVENMKSLNIGEDQNDKQQERHSNYCGHFILVLGFDLKNQQIFYHDPSAKDGYSVCSLKSFEDAWRSFGTDEDILFTFPPSQT
uniref:Protein GUCD1 n=1 Tax=Phallusia mammillata TaxID=59560 RepID=A0A6F9DDN2_9ASCI|nr:protein GUCD1 [Phallusia mammillata]